MANHSPVHRAARVVAVEADWQIADAISTSLHSKGVPIPGEPDSDAAIIAVLSNGSASDPSWLSSIEQYRGKRIIPVSVGQPIHTKFPTFLTELNWIIWDEREVARVLAQIFIAVQTDLDLYRTQRTLEAEAYAWQAAGKPDDQLISDFTRAHNAHHEITTRTGDTLAKRPALVREFVEQSLRHARRLRQRRNFRWIRRSALAVIVAITVTAIFATSREFGRHNPLWYSASEAVPEGRPDLRGIKLASLLLLEARSEDRISPVAFRQLAKSISEPWSRGIIGAQSEFPTNSIALLAGPDLAVTADGQGAVTWWNTSTGDVLDRVQLQAGPIYTMATNADGTVVATASNESVSLVRTDLWTKTTATANSAVNKLAISDLHRQVVYATSEQEIFKAGYDDLDSPEKVGRYNTIVDMRRTTDETVVALVRDNELLQIIDAVQGEVLAEAEWLPTQFEKGAVAPDGMQVVVHGVDGQLWYAERDLDFEPTGQAVPDVVTAISLTSLSWVLFSSDEFGTQIYDTKNGLLLGKLCDFFGRVDAIVVADSGDRSSCGSRGLVELSHIGQLGPDLSGEVKVMPSDSGLSVSRRHGVIRAISIENDVLITISLDSGEDRSRSMVLDPTASLMTSSGDFLPKGPVSPVPTELQWAPGTLNFSGRPSVVAITEDGMTAAIGSSDGVVTEIELTDEGNYEVVNRWVAPDRAAVKRIGWTPDGSRLVVETSKHVWNPSSCAGCLREMRIIERVRAQVWSCYLPEALEEMNLGSARHALGLRECPQMPPPRVL